MDAPNVARASASCASSASIAPIVPIMWNSPPASTVADSQLQGIAAFPRRDRTNVLKLAHGQGRIYRSDGSVRTERKSDFLRFERFRAPGPPSQGGMDALKCDHRRMWIGMCVLAFGPLPPARVHQYPWPDNCLCCGRTSFGGFPIPKEFRPNPRTPSLEQTGT